MPKHTEVKHYPVHSRSETGQHKNYAKNSGGMSVAGGPTKVYTGKKGSHTAVTSVTRSSIDGRPPAEFMPKRSGFSL